jgi:Flp pilus assembly protein TadG
MSIKSAIVDFIYRLGRNNRGAVAVEFSIILPAMMIMYFGTFEASRLVRAYMTANKAAQVIANLVAAGGQAGGGGVTASDSTDFCAAGKLAMLPFPGASLKATMASITKNLTSGTVAFDWQDTTCGGGAGTFSSATTAANGILSANGDTMIIVKIQYNYAGTVHFVLPGSYTISQTAYQRPRTGGTIPHS